MASVQEKNLSQLSRENGENSLSFLVFRRCYYIAVVGLFIRHSVPFSLEYLEKPDFCRVAFSPDNVPMQFYQDLGRDFRFPDRI